jgi:hypothetical protein
MHRHWIGLMLGLLMVLAAPVMAAPYATVTGIVLKVTYRATATGAWATAKVGSKIFSGGRIRTAARSKVEVKFPDGSRVRLNELSDLVITDAGSKNMNLASGNLYARIIAGSGARITGAGGVASIKGTHLSYDGQTLAVYEGKAVHELDRGNENVAAGTASHCKTPGVYAVPPEKWEGGQFRPWFTDLRPGISFQAFSGTPVGQETKYERAAMWAAMSSLGLPADTGGLDVILEGAGSAQGGASDAGLGMAAALMAAAGSGDCGPLRPLQRLTGNIFGPSLEGEAYGIEGEGSEDLAGAHVRAGLVSGDWYAGFGGMGQARNPSTKSATFLSEAFLAHRDDSGDFTVGRQWFTQGPINNTRLGSLCSFDIADAVRWQGSVSGLDLDLSYLDDMVVPSSEDLRGGLARVQGYLLGGEVAVNVLYAAQHHGTGISADFSMPVWPDVLDLYGEFGSDPEGRHLETWGAYFPGLFQSLGIDLYLERCERAGSPALNSASLYKEFSGGWTAVALYKEATNDDPVFGIGLAKTFRAW